MFCGGEVGFEEDGGGAMERLEGEDLRRRRRRSSFWKIRVTG